MDLCSMRDDGDYHYMSGVHYFNSDVEYDVSGGSEKMLLEEKLQRRINIYEDQLRDKDLEIAKLKKQASALRDVNESRLKIYERLEDKIVDLERANHKLLKQSKNDKSALQMLMKNIEEEEVSCTIYKAKIGDLTKELKDVNLKLKNMVQLQEAQPPTNGRNSPETDKSLIINYTEILDQLSLSQDELMESQQRSELLEMHIQDLRRKIKDLEDELCYVNNTNRAQNETACTCKKKLPSVYEEVEEDDGFLMNLSKESQYLFNGFNFTSDPPKPEVNMYKDLVDKYQKLLDLHRTGIEDFRSRTNDSGYSTLETIENNNNTDMSVQTDSKCTEFKRGLGSICVYGDVNEHLLEALETTLQSYNYRKDSVPSELQQPEQVEEASSTTIELSTINDESIRYTFVTSTPDVTKSKSRKKLKSSKGSSLFNGMMKENFKNENTPIKVYRDAKLIPQPKLIPLVRKPLEEMVLVPASKKSQKKKNNKQPIQPQLVGEATWKVASATKKSKASKTFNTLF